MFKKIISGYAGILRACARVFLLFLACVIIGFSLVFPLWKFAVGNPNLYTLFVCLLCACAVLFFVFVKLRTYFKQCADACERRKRLVALLRIVAKYVSLIAGLVLSLFLLVFVSRAAALVSLFATIILYGVFAFGFRKT